MRQPGYDRQVVRQDLEPELVFLGPPLRRVEGVAEPPLDSRDRGLRQAPPVVPLPVELPAPPPHHQHLSPGLRPLRPDPDDVLLGGDVGPPIVPGDEVANLPREVRLVRAETAELPDELQELLHLLGVCLERRDDLEREDEEGPAVNYEVQFEEVFASFLPAVPYGEPSHVPPDREAGAIDGTDATTLAPLFEVRLLHDVGIERVEVLPAQAVHRPLEVHPPWELPEPDDRSEVPGVSRQGDEVSVELAEPHLEEEADHERPRVVLYGLSPVARVWCPWPFLCVDEFLGVSDELSVLLLLAVFVVVPLAFSYHGRLDGLWGGRRAALRRLYRRLYRTLKG